MGDSSYQSLSALIPLFRLQDEWCRGPGDASLTWLLLMQLEPLSRAAATCGFPCIIDRASSQFSKGQVTPVRAPPTMDPASYLLHAVLFCSVRSILSQELEKMGVGSLGKPRHKLPFSGLG